MGDWLTNLFMQPQALAPMSALPASASSASLAAAAAAAAAAANADDAPDLVHGGVLQAARFVLARCGDLLRVLSESGVKVAVVGHSLGAGVATVVAMVLREELKVSNVLCFAYAPPPAVSRRAALRCKEYVFSAVHCDDVIPRTGVAQLKAFVASVCKLRDIQRMGGGDWSKVEAMLDRVEWSQIERTALAAHAERVYDTYLPGRVLFLFGGGDLGKYRALEVDGEFAPLRMPVLSKRMLTDHYVDAYRAALGDVS